MARGRIISPDFWTDGRMISLTPYARLFYIGTWNFATCDRGHLPDDALGLKLKILPADHVDATELLDELMTAGRIVRIQIAGQSFLQIPTFERNQSGSKESRWKPRCTACKLSEPLQSFQESSTTPANSSKLPLEGEGETSYPEGGGSAAPRKTCLKHPDGSDAPCGACKEARLRFEKWERDNAAKPAGPPTLTSLRAKCRAVGHITTVNPRYCDRCGDRVNVAEARAA